LIFAYHGFRADISFIEMFMPPDIFREQVAYLSRVVKVVSLGEYVRSRQSNTRPEGDLVMITVDDGYADNHAVMLPLVRQLGVPMTVFLTTDCVSFGSPTNVVAFMLAVECSRVPVLELPGFGLAPMPISTPGDRERAIVTLDQLGKALARHEQDHLVARVFEACGTTPEESGATRLMLTWDQVREMHRSGIEFGGHSRTHAVLSRLSDEQVAREINGSLEVVSREVGAPIDLFAYPYGGADEVGPRVIRICGASQARAAVTLINESPDECSLHALGRDMMTLDRCATPWGSFSRALFALELSGIPNSARAALGRLRRHPQGPSDRAVSDAGE
jgi:peptidoglycan/xylan/chitin deacetylase (PgdA/CDA1 family)